MVRELDDFQNFGRALMGFAVATENYWLLGRILGLWIIIISSICGNEIKFNG